MHHFHYIIYPHLYCMSAKTTHRRHQFKSGLIRQLLMGKRVTYCHRSVISSAPMLNPSYIIVDLTPPKVSTNKVKERSKSTNKYTNSTPSKVPTNKVKERSKRMYRKKYINLNSGR